MSIVLKRTGQSDLVIDGELIEKASSCVDDGTTRWHDISVFRTTSDKFVLAIIYHGDDGETNHDYADIHDTLQSVDVTLKHVFNPCEHVVLGDDNDVNKRIVYDVKGRFDVAVRSIVKAIKPDIMKAVRDDIKSSEL